MAARHDEHGNVVHIGEQEEEGEEQLAGGDATGHEGPPPPGCGEQRPDPLCIPHPLDPLL